jgi:hypothetical protein
VTNGLRLDPRPTLCLPGLVRLVEMPPGQDAVANWPAGRSQQKPVGRASAAAEALHWGRFLSTVPIEEAAASTLEDLLLRGAERLPLPDAIPTGRRTIPSTRRLGRLLTRLVRQGHVQRKGSGRMNDPFRYWRRPDSSLQP